MTQTAERQEKKAQRRIQAAKDFTNEINRTGGYYNFEEASRYLNISHSELHSLVFKRGVLGFKIDNQYVFPKFQFKNNEVIEEYKLLIPVFNVSNVAATSFMMTGYIIRGNDEVAYYEAMPNITEEEFELIKRDALLYGTPTAS